ncbi:MFS transporter [Herbaspirillum frisingense]|nr:MFS transporter [Herbaspirillum frisingense]QNB06732.1 MFS transporter [Herbaspirillum frisingense]
MWLLSPVMVTLIFAMYAIGLLAALLTLGALSDYMGRRRVICGSLLVSAVAMATLHGAHSATALLSARFVQGIGTGAAASSIGAMLLDVRGRQAATINSATAFFGTTLGAAFSGVLLLYSASPIASIYGTLFWIFVILAGFILSVPETAQRRQGVLRALLPTIFVPLQARRAFLKISFSNIAGWALGGFYLSLMPSVMRSLPGEHSDFINVIVVAILTLSGCAAILACQSLHAGKLLMAGSFALAAGTGVTLWGVHLASGTTLLAGTIVAGLGFGANFSGASRSVFPLAEPHERAGLLSAFYVESYSAFSLPVILAGLCIPRFGLLDTTYGFGALIVLFALVSCVITSFTVKVGVRQA